MLRFAMIALVGAVSAVGAAQAVVSVDAARQASAAPAAVAPQAEALRLPEPDSVSSGAAAQIIKASDGHYWAEASVNGQQVHFLVDTGATAVALTVNDAKRLGLDPDNLNYAYKVMTAGGEARAAAVKLASVSVAGARVNDVEALVIEKGLDSSLLGMTYLGRLSRFEATRSALILRP